MLTRFCLSLMTICLVQSGRITVAANRTVHEPNITRLVQRVMTGTFTVDPLFVDFVSHPSNVYTDFYGIHVLQDFTSAQIVADFVPTYANVSRYGNTIVDLMFKKGWNATFYPNAILKVKTAAVTRDHVFIGGNNASELIDNLKDFRRILTESKLESKYLIPNPYFDVEKLVDTQYYSGKPRVAVTVDANMTEFLSRPDAILIYADRLHGDLSKYNAFMAELKRADVQWLGMEMLPSSMQHTLEYFCTAPNTSVEYANARRQLTDYFYTNWTPYFQLNITSGEQSPYFHAVDLMRQKKGRVYGLDFDTAEFFLFRYGESNYGASVRSHNWAMSVPNKGRGIIFGGSSHFTMNRSANVQDFLVIRDRNVTLFSIDQLGPATTGSAAHRLVNHFVLFFACLAYVLLGH